MNILSSNYPNCLVIHGQIAKKKLARPLCVVYPKFFVVSGYFPYLKTIKKKQHIEKNVENKMNIFVEMNKLTHKYILRYATLTIAVYNLG